MAAASGERRIFANQRADDWALVNAEDERVMARSEGIASQRVLFALAGRIREGFLVDGDWIGRKQNLVDKLAANRRRAVLLTEQAQAAEDSAPE